MHYISGLNDIKPFEEAARVMLEFIAQLKKLGIEIEELNLGGGFGIKYTSEDDQMNMTNTLSLFLRL